MRRGTVRWLTTQPGDVVARASRILPSGAVAEASAAIEAAKSLGIVRDLCDQVERQVSIDKGLYQGSVRRRPPITPFDQGNRYDVIITVTGEPADRKDRA